MIRKKLVSMLSAIALVLSLFTLLPEGALKAHALSGSGTQSDPFIVTTYDELKSIFSYQDREEYFIKLGKDIIQEDNLNNNFLSTDNIFKTIHFDLAGHTLKRKARTLDEDMIIIKNGSTLIIDDSVGNGKIVCELSNGDANNEQNLINIHQGTLEINSGIFDYENAEYYDPIIRCDYNNSNVTINDGVFYGKCCTIFRRSGIVTINGGKFYNTDRPSTNGYLTNWYQFCIDTRYSGEFIINNCELIAKNADKPAGFTEYTGQSTYCYIKMQDYTSSSAVVNIDGTTIDKTKKTDIVGKRILIYTPKNITGFYWDGYKLKWDDYSNPSTNYYNINLEKKNGDSYNTVKQDIITGATSFDFEEYIKANGAGTYKVLIAAFTKEHEQISNLMRTEKYFDPRETVSEISLAVTEPKDGVTITKATPSSTGEKRYTVTKSLWFKGTSTSGAAMESTEKFVEGQTYTLYCEVRTTSGYKFVSPSATVNGKTAATVNHTGDGIVSLKYTVTAPLNVKTVNVTATAPKAGAKPSVGDVTLTGTGVVIAPVNVKQNGTSVKVENTVLWSLGEEVLDVGTSKFEAGKTYTAAVYLKAADGYEIVNDDLKVYINGKEAELDPASLLSLILYGTVIYKAEFECKASGQQLLGDVNKDGKVTADDAIIIARLAAGYGDYSTRYDSNVADMNRDGKATADDAIIAARLAAGYGDYVTRYTKYI